mmetsp:Transcript_19936/g.28908  ORF Transcript_19936/g.28908 Transcript_19936/m.28908 type:complete len:321 (+) Transcript_19936:150-1112(+)
MRNKQSSDIFDAYSISQEKKSDELTQPLISLSSFSDECVVPTNIIRLTSSSSRAGLGITEKKMKNSSEKVVIVKFVLSDGIAKIHNIQPGMIILDYDNTMSIVKRMECGPYPFDLRFYSPLPSEVDAIEKISSKSRISDPWNLLSGNQRNQILTKFISSAFVIIHSLLFGWVETFTTDRPKKKTCWCKGINEALVASALSTEMVKKVDEGLFHEALVVANEALTLQRKCEGRMNPNIGRILNFIGIILSQMDSSNNYMALTSFEESLTIMQETLGYGDEETSFALHNMWLLLHNERERQKLNDNDRNEINMYKGALPIHT